jgi:putative PIN family toxin of toxin-antitoxin system
MRALFDTNVYISYLLPSKAESAIERIMNSAFEGTFTLLIAQEIVKEFSRKVASKSYLAKRISREQANDLMEGILAVAEVISVISTAIPNLPVITRDRKDDYLLAYAVVGEADYLVTGDDDLLALGIVEGVNIVTPASFLVVLSDQQPPLQPK